MLFFQRTEEEIQHHSRTKAGHREGEWSGDHRQRPKADPGPGSGMFPELAGGGRDLPEL